MAASPFIPNDHPGGILAAIVDSSDDAIFATDLDGTILTWNRGAARMYGYAAEEIVGRSAALLMPEDRVADEMDARGRTIAAGEHIEHHETVWRTRDGRLVDVSVNISPLRDAEGRIVGASAIARDITEQRRVERALRASEAHWRSIVESAVDAIIVIDHRGIVEGFNPAAKRLFGYEASEVIGRNVSMLMPAPYRDEHDGYMANYVRTGHAEIIGIGREVTALRKDGTTFPVHLAVGEMVIEGEHKFTGILHDLTARVQMELHIREQAALTKLGEMAAVVAHEVKNPLTGIRGAIQVIGSRLPAGSKDAAVAKEIIARIDALNDLMKDMLLFARPPQPKFAPLDIRELIETVTHLVRMDAAMTDLAIEITGSAPAIAGDAELLKIVVQNLLINSAHAMQGRGTIRVSIGADGGTCRIAVADEGPGIPVGVRERLFTPFFTTKSRGTGLGLSTAKRLVEAHSGQIDVQCPPSGGTVVTVQFPVQVV